MVNAIDNNLNSLQGDISDACKAAGRAPEDVSLIAVSKKQEESRIVDALEAGQRIFGENRVQEAQERWSKRREAYADLTLHLIGPLQTNKVKDAVALFDVIQSVDREKLARSLAKEMQKQQRALPCFIQVNTGEEEQKSGIALDDLAAFMQFCRNECGLNIVGLMCIPPADEAPALHFALLKKMADAQGLSQISMGMSGDYKTAIAMGATCIRVGTGVFGPRLNT